MMDTQKENKRTDPRTWSRYFFFFPDTQPGVPAGPLMAACVLSLLGEKGKEMETQLFSLDGQLAQPGHPRLLFLLLFLFLFHMLSLLHQESLGAVALVC